MIENSSKFHYFFEGPAGQNGFSKNNRAAWFNHAPQWSLDKLGIVLYNKNTGMRAILVSIRVIIAS